MDKILKQNIRKFFDSANLIYGTGDYTSATILYFKCLFSVLDLIIYRALNRTPKDHAERFRILENKFPEFYFLLDKLYPNYRNTYTSTSTKLDCDRIRKDVEKLIEEQRIL